VLRPRREEFASCNASRHFAPRLFESAGAPRFAIVHQLYRFSFAIGPLVARPDGSPSDLVDKYALSGARTVHLKRIVGDRAWADLAVSVDNPAARAEDGSIEGLSVSNLAVGPWSLVEALASEAFSVGAVSVLTTPLDVRGCGDRRQLMVGRSVGPTSILRKNMRSR